MSLNATVTWTACSFCLDTIATLSLPIEGVTAATPEAASHAAGALVLGSGVLPHWLGWASILAGIMFLLKGFGQGGVIATFGLVLDLIGFVRQRRQDASDGGGRGNQAAAAARW